MDDELPTVAVARRNALPIERNGAQIAGMPVADVIGDRRAVLVDFDSARDRVAVRGAVRIADAVGFEQLQPRAVDLARPVTVATDDKGVAGFALRAIGER